MGDRCRKPQIAAHKIAATNSMRISLHHMIQQDIEMFIELDKPSTWRVDIIARAYRGTIVHMGKKKTASHVQAGARYKSLYLD